jgi:hypothetical protein
VERPRDGGLEREGLRFNAYKDTLAQFDGSERTVKFALRPLKGQLRVAALVNEQVLGFVSSETPVQQGIRRMSLTHSQAVVYAA